MKLTPGSITNPSTKMCPGSWEVGTSDFLLKVRRYNFSFSFQRLVSVEKVSNSSLFKISKTEKTFELLVICYDTSIELLLKIV